MHYFIKIFYSKAVFLEILSSKRAQNVIGIETYYESSWCTNRQTSIWLKLNKVIYNLEYSIWLTLVTKDICKIEC